MYTQAQTQAQAQALAFYPFSSFVSIELLGVLCSCSHIPSIYHLCFRSQAYNVYIKLCALPFTSFVVWVSVCKLFGSVGLTRVTKESFLNTSFHVFPFSSFFFTHSLFSLSVCFVGFGLFVISILYFRTASSSFTSKSIDLSRYTPSKQRALLCVCYFG